MSLRSDYDAWHQRVLESDPAHRDASSPWYELVREQIDGVAGLRILEVACGRGGFVSELARAGAKVAGCDFSFAALRVANTSLLVAGRRETAVLVQGDAQSLPFADASFDIVVSCETIEHLPNVHSAVKEMHRVTRPGGKLFLTTPNYANLMGLYELYCWLRRRQRKLDQPFDRRQYFPQIRKYLRQAGWTILRTDGTVHQFPLVPGRPPVRVKAVEKNRTVRRFLSPLALHYFVMAQKRNIA